MSILAAWVLLSMPPAHPALWFDGAAQLVVPATPALDIGNQMTLEAWVWPSPTTTMWNFTYILSKNEGNTGYGMLSQGHDVKKLHASGDPGIDVKGNLAPIGQWTHVAFVKSGASEALYVNGRLIGQVATTDVINTNGLPLYLGSSPFGVGSEGCNWIGGLKEVRIWSVARSEGQIRRSMDRRLTGKEKGLAAYFPMDEGYGLDVHDRTGHTVGGHLPAQKKDHVPQWVKL